MLLSNFFTSRFAPISASGTAKAYLSGLFADQAHKPVDFSRDSLVLTYYGIRHTFDLTALQALGDWVLWANTCFPKNTTEVSESLGRLSYYRCYRLVPTWVVYEELADNMPTLIPQLRQTMIKKSVDFTTQSQLALMDAVGIEPT